MRKHIKLHIRSVDESDLVETCASRRSFHGLNGTLCSGASREDKDADEVESNQLARMHRGEKKNCSKFNLKFQDNENLRIPEKSCGTIENGTERSQDHSEEDGQQLVESHQLTQSTSGVKSVAQNQLKPNLRRRDDNKICDFDTCDGRNDHNCASVKIGRSDIHNLSSENTVRDNVTYQIMSKIKLSRIDPHLKGKNDGDKICDQDLICLCCYKV